MNCDGKRPGVMVFGAIRERVSDVVSRDEFD